LKGKDFFPVVFHADDGPALGVGLVEGFIKFADGGCAVVGILAVGVGVMNEEHEAGPWAGGCPFEHLLVAVGVAKGSEGTLTNKCVDADGFAWTVVDEANLRQAHDDGGSVLCLKLRFHRRPNDLLGRYAVGFFCPGTHKSDLSTRDDECLEVVGAKVGEELDHGLVDELRIGSIELAIMGLSDPVGDGFFKLGARHTGTGGDDNLIDPLFAGCHDGFHVAVENSFKRLLRLPLRMLGGHLLDAVEGKEELGIHGGFDPESAVVIEGGDAVSDGNEVRGTFFRDAVDEGDNVFLRGGVAPGRERIFCDLVDGRCGVLILASQCGKQQKRSGQKIESKRKVPYAEVPGLHL